MRSLGIAALAAGLAIIASGQAIAADSGPDQQRWGDVPHAELKAPGAPAQWDRYEDGGYDDDRLPPPPPDYGPDYRYDEVTGGIEGTWEGTWRGQYDDGRPYEYSGSFDGEYRPAGAPYDYPPPYAPGPYHAPGHNPAVIHQGEHVIINGMAYPAGGTFANGFYYPPPTTTTITVHSGCCQHAEPAAVWTPKPKKHWKPKPRSKIIRMTK